MGRPQIRRRPPRPCNEEEEEKGIPFGPQTFTGNTWPPSPELAIHPSLFPVLLGESRKEEGPAAEA